MFSSIFNIFLCMGHVRGDGVGVLLMLEYTLSVMNSYATHATMFTFVVLVVVVYCTQSNM